MENRDDLSCLQNLAGSLTKIKESKFCNNNSITADVSDFYKQLAIMSHVIYPVTSESLKVMGRFNSKESYDSIPSNFIKRLIIKRGIYQLASLAIVGLIMTGYFFFLSISGASIVERLDLSLRERNDIIRELNDEIKLSDNSKPKSFNINIKIIDRKATLNRLRIKSLIDQLDDWNDSIFGRMILHSIEKEALANKPGDGIGGGNISSHQNTTTKSVNISKCDDLSGDQYSSCMWNKITTLPSEYILEKNLTIKNNGLLVLQVINNCILLLLFGACGSVAYLLRKTSNALQNHTFTDIRWTTWIRVLLGTFSGFFLGYLTGNNELINLLSSESTAVGSNPSTISMVSPWTMAFIGGYSADLLFSVINRFIYAITNDERYLPASEQMKRKVDSSKLINSNKDKYVNATPDQDNTGK